MQTIPDLFAVLDANPADQSSRALLITRLERGKQIEEAGEQRVFLAYLQSGGSAVLVQAVELLLEALRDRCHYRVVETAGGAIWLEGPGGVRPAAVSMDGGAIVVRLADRLIRFSGVVSIVEIADFVCPVWAVEQLRPEFDPDREEWPIEPELQKLARRIARKRFPEDDEAESAALDAARRAVRRFDGWGHVDKLAASFVRFALKTHRRYVIRRDRRDRQLRKRAREQACRRQAARGTHNGRPVHTADEAPTDVAGGVDAALALLPPDLREPIERHHLRGESAESIAVSLGVDVRTIQRRLKEGRELLTKKLLEK